MVPISGYKNTNVKDLKVRDWICTLCNTKHDRDINAAKTYWQKD